MESAGGGVVETGVALASKTEEVHETESRLAQQSIDVGEQTLAEIDRRKLRLDMAHQGPSQQGAAMFQNGVGSALHVDLEKIHSHRVR